MTLLRYSFFMWISLLFIGRTDSFSHPNNRNNAIQCNNQIDRFLCDNGKCISLNKTCDANNDCGDNSDEHIEECTNAANLCQIIGCSHRCNRTPKGPMCSCPADYKLVNNRTCTDTIDCANNSNVCDHRCVNANGTYHCICDEGYEIQSDKKTCKVKGDVATLIFSAKDSIRCVHIDSDEYFPDCQDSQQNASTHADYIYWLDIKKGEEAIMRSRNDFTKSEVIVSSGLGLTEEIAVDWITGNIYFTDSLYKHIGVCNNNGSQCTTIISGTSGMLRGLALYPQNGQMFWSDYGAQPHISLAGMDGKGDKPLIIENLGWPNGLAIDYSKRRLYWVDAKRMVIESVQLDGSDRREVLHTTLTHPYSIAIFGNEMYWSEWETNSIQSADKSSGKNRRIRFSGVDPIYGIHIHHSKLEPNMSNPCETQPCSQLCLLAINRTYSCACTLDHELNIDGHSCNLTGNTERLLIPTGRTLILYHHEILGKQKVTEYLMPRRILHATYDPVNGAILGTELSKLSIHSLSEDYNISKMMEIYVDDIVDMEYDSYANNLYCSNPRQRTIEIHSLETFEKTVIQCIEAPLDILLIPEQGTMYVVFMDKGLYHIDRLPMSGIGPRNRIVDNVQGPTISLAYDAELERVFWADEAPGRIESVSVQGDDRKLFRTGLQGPISLAVLGGNIFWITGDPHKLQWADKENKFPGNKNVTLQTNFSGVKNLITIGSVNNGTQHKCRIDGGGCSHVCLVAVTEQRICSCPPGMILGTDMRTCKWVPVCTSEEIRCSDNNSCINKMQRCNGIEDCPNGEDEKECYCSATNK